MSAPVRETKPATPQLLKLLIEQNEECLRGFRRAFANEFDPAAKEQIAMSGEQLAEQTKVLRERLDEALRKDEKWSIPGRRF